MGLAVVTYCILAYVFMWPPVVTEIRSTRTVNPCMMNLHLIDEAIHQWAIEHGKHDGDPVTMIDITPYIRNGRGEVCKVSCFRGGEYAVTVVGAAPTCSVGWNTDPKKKIRVGYFHFEYFGPAHALP